jgi:hypothetical protein
VNARTRFRVKSPEVVHETIDGEVVIIHFDTGNYYSLDHVGADVWGLVEHGATLQQIVEGLGRRYDGDQGNMEAAVQGFVDELLRENLVVGEDTGEATSSGNRPAPTQAGQQIERPGFVPPFLHKYTDMQELLLLDPIHEVDETGWPSVQPDASVSNS